jgi:2-polyprenyl-3-methyl-5-hydroxy-6-metoxy-1,4-benzoquinol methylase
MRRPGNVLEVGSYVGAFLTAAREAGLAVQGLDVNASVNAFARGRGFAIHDGDLASLDGEESFDAVTIWNTFDQVSDPRATLFAASRLLRRGALLVIRVPNGGFYARKRRMLGARRRISRALARELLAQNNLLGFPYRWGFGPASLTRLLRDTGFAVERFYGDVLVPVADNYTRTWARLEEIVVKGAMSIRARTSPGSAPWLEVYARKL